VILSLPRLTRGTVSPSNCAQASQDKHKQQTTMVHSIAAWVVVAVVLATAPVPVGAQSLSSPTRGPGPGPPPTRLTVAPQRAGPTYACGGSFQAWLTSTSGSATCSGVPFINQTFLGGVCGSYTESDGGTEFGFALSNGGMCLGFNTSQRCQAAVSNLPSIISTAHLDQYVSLGGSEQCFLRQSSCARYSNVTATAIPQCGAAPNPTPGWMCAPADFTPAAPIRDTTSGATCATMQAAFVGADLYGFSSLCDVVPDATDVFTWSRDR
jgi:hypothetical protein